MAWLDQGMSMGSATAFMITGPVTKITNLAAVKMFLELNISSFTWYLPFCLPYSAGLL